MKPFVWGLVGPGAIAHRFAEAVTQLPGHGLRAVVGRDAGRAAAFAARWSARALSDVDALLADRDIDAVYIASPHTGHGDSVRRCLQAGKAVLCEKPLVPNAAQARDLVALSQRCGVFLMEALWTRFLPAYAQARRWLQAGAIGRVQAVQSSFCFAAPFDPRSRLFDAAQAGGALLDIGIYNVAMTRWALEAAWGACPAPLRVQAEGLLAPTGVDQRVAATLTFPQGVVSQFVCALDGGAANALHVFGSEGELCLPRPFWGATEAVLSRPAQAPLTVPAPFRINGFEGQIEEVERCVRAGRVESPGMPHAETIAVLDTLDALRRELGVAYPFERSPG
ncbi:MAG: gfo/Idh/MocA family oxidoreductase [Leptothrix sp. (in: Bacteria)]|nr:gfo/Idh/MocA family oxidoreductase [Leptothrix sp. (in: b-proteobacteria)]